MNNPLIIVIGAYGSGKSEYAINLAKKYSEQELSVSLADLDVVNPYFRSREVREKFKKDNIEVIAPEGSYSHADLPMLSPRIKGEIENHSKVVILDVGGDPNGCRTLGRYREQILKRGYKMKFIVNTKRPFTSDKDGIIKMYNELEQVSKLKIDEIICNTNLLDTTTEKEVKKGIEIIDKVAQEKDVAFNKYLVLQNNQDKIPDNLTGKKRIILEYFLNKPWEMPVLKGV